MLSATDLSSRRHPGRRGTVATTLAATVAVVLTACTGGTTTPGPTAGATGGAGATGDSGPLATWQRALDDRADEPATWLAVGDSLTEGQGASGRATRWLDLARDDLRERFPVDGVAGGAGQLPARFAVYGPDSPWGSWQSSLDGSARLDTSTPALGQRALDLAAGTTITYPVTGDGLDLWWTPGGGRATVTVDDGDPVDVDTTAGSGGASSPGAVVTSVDDLDPGEHDVTVTAVDDVALEGLTAYDGDRTAGVTTVDAARSGATTQEVLAELPGLVARAEAVSPDLVTVSLGINDAATGRSPEQVAADLTTLVEALQGLGSSPSVVLLGEFVPGTSVATALPGPLAEYTAAVRGVADATGSAYVGLEEALPEDGLEDLLAADGLHPADPGQRLVADLLVRTLGD